MSSICGLFVAFLCLVLLSSPPGGDATLLKVLSILNPDEEPVFSTSCEWNQELMRKSPEDLEGLLVHSYPKDACAPIGPPPLPPSSNGSYPIEPDWILIATWDRADRCTLMTKLTLADKAGYSSVVIQLDEDDDTVDTAFLAGDDWDNNLSIYPCLVSSRDGKLLWTNFTTDEYIIRFEDESIDTWTRLFITTFLALIAILLAIALSYCVVQMFILLVVWIRNTVVDYIETRRLNRRRRLPSSQLKRIPVQEWSSAIPQDMCTICLENYVDLEKIRVLPCSHVFHMTCIDPWLLNQRRKCPNCKRKIVFPEEPYDSDSSTEDERTPLLRRETGGSSSQLDHALPGGLTFTFNESDFTNQQQPIYRAIHRMMIEANARQRAAQEQRVQNQTARRHSTSSTGPSPSSSSSSASPINAAILQHSIRHNRLSRFCPRKRLPQSLFGSRNVDTATPTATASTSTNSIDGDYLEDTTTTTTGATMTTTIGHDNPNYSSPSSNNEIHNRFLAEGMQAYEDCGGGGGGDDHCTNVMQTLQRCDETVASIEGEVCEVSPQNEVQDGQIHQFGE